MREATVINDVVDLMKEVFQLWDLRKEHKALFRGQDTDKPLLPRVARQKGDQDTVDSALDEKKVLRDLLRRNHVYKELQTNDPWHQLMIAQHHGLNTRLLDWTTNPMVALWFGCASAVTKGVGAHLYLLLPTTETLLQNVSAAEDPFAPRDCATAIILQPSFVTPRLTAQAGCFTAHSYQRNGQGWVPIEEDSRLTERLYHFTIPSARVEVILEQLPRLGISAESLFPDLDGTCRHLNWLHERRPRGRQKP